MYIEKGKMIEYLAIFAIGIYIVMQINGLSLLNAVSSTYTTFYFRTLTIGLVSVVGMVAFSIFYFSQDPLGLGWKASVGIMAAFTVFISLLTFTGTQIWPVPQAFAEPLAMGAMDNYITSSLIPGFSEDLLYLCAFPMILALFYFIPKTVWFGGVGRMEFLAVSLVACMIAATGYGIWVVPGFTTSHVPAYGNLQGAYGGAWIFSTAQSAIYLTTGIFAPVPHIVHNAIVTYQSLYMVVTV